MGYSNGVLKWGTQMGYSNGDQFTGKCAHVCFVHLCATAYADLCLADDKLFSASHDHTLKEWNTETGPSPAVCNSVLHVLCGARLLYGHMLHHG